jgi:GNAT superfamily N-acetyltransferase
MNSNIYIREYVKTDEEYVALAHLHNDVFPDDPVSGEELREEDEHIDDTKYVSRRLIARVTDTDELVAQMEFNHVPTRFHPQRFWVWLEVHPNYQRQGIGSALYDKVLNELKPLKPIAFQTAARETRAEAISFLGKRGFREVSRTFESHLELKNFDFPQNRPVLDSEIIVSTLTDEKRVNPNWLRELHELYSELGYDVPSTDEYTPIAIDEFQKRVDGNPVVIDDAYFLAKIGSEYIGNCYVHKIVGEPTHLIQEFTGVRQAFRRNGIALALKYKVLEYAQAHGIERIRTWNDTTNQGMLAINDKLGFVKEPAWIKLKVDLTK